MENCLKCLGQICAPCPENKPGCIVCHQVEHTCTKNLNITEKPYQIPSDIAEKLKQSEQYLQDCRCDNCNYEERRLFPKGQTSDGYFECPNCGCKKLRVSWKHTVDLNFN